MFPIYWLNIPSLGKLNLAHVLWVARLKTPGIVFLFEIDINFSHQANSYTEHNRPPWSLIVSVLGHGLITNPSNLVVKNV
jgi:hypothetical protein